MSKSDSQMASFFHPADYSVRETSSMIVEMPNFKDSNTMSSSTLNLTCYKNKTELNARLHPKLTSFPDHVIIDFYASKWFEELTVQYQLSILDSNKLKQYSQVYFHTFKKANEDNFTKLISRTDLLEQADRLLPGGTLTVLCEVKVLKMKVTSIELITGFDLPTEGHILKNLGTLLENSNHSDVVFVVGEKELKAHKLILGAQSPVFAAMFEHDCKEKQESRVDITDVPLEVFEELLRYIYTEKVNSLGEHATELLVAADKYQLDSLKYLCEKHLASNLTVETVAQILFLADMHQATKLKPICIEFITDNSNEVMATNGWKVLAENVDLLVELYGQLSKRFQWNRIP